MSEPDDRGRTPPDTTAAEGPPGQAERPTLLQRVRAAPITVGLAVINGIVFVVAESHGSTTQVGTLLQFGASERLHVWAGEPWRLFTPMFLHIGWGHLLWNTYASFGWCVLLEPALGKKRFLLLYLLSGVGGACASVLGQQVVSAGASGAMFGVIGATLALRRRMLPSMAAFFADPGVRSIFMSIAIWTAIGLSVLSMDHFAHGGGLVIGALVAWIMSSPPTGRGARWAAFSAAFATLVLFAGRPWWKPTPEQAQVLGAYGTAWLSGDHFPKNERRGIAMGERACAAGDTDTCISIATILRDRGGDVATAMRLLQEACDKGRGIACTELAVAEEKHGGPEAVSRAAALHRKGCDAGYAPGCTFLAHLFTRGEGVTKDETQAVRLYEKACLGGDPLGCGMFGVALRTGIGVPRDVERGTKLLADACAKDKRTCELGAIESP